MGEASKVEGSSRETFIRRQPREVYYQGTCLHCYCEQEQIVTFVKIYIIGNFI
jgi:hypothetical protein